MIIVGQHTRHSKPDSVTQMDTNGMLIGSGEPSESTRQT